MVFTTNMRANLTDENPVWRKHNKTNCGLGSRSMIYLKKMFSVES